MVTSSLKRLIINVNKEMKPCHNPIKNPAGSASNFSFPGAHDVSAKINETKRMIGTKFLVFFMVNGLMLSILLKSTNNLISSIPLSFYLRLYDVFLITLRVIFKCNDNILNSLTSPIMKSILLPLAWFCTLQAAILN